MRTITAAIVSWNSGDDLQACVRSLALARERLPEADRRSVSLVIADNASDQFDESAVLASFPDAHVLRLPRNIGFGPGCNAAAAKAKGEILLLLNPDTRAVGEPFSPIAAAFDSDTGCAAVAPRLSGGEIGNSGETQESFQLRHLPTLRSAARELLLFDRLFPANRFRRAERYMDADRRGRFEVEQPAAAALAIRKTDFDAIGGFDPIFVPAYFEDVDLARRLRGRGRIRFEPDAVFEHRGGAASATLGYARFLPLYYRNAIAYWRKHEGALRTAAFRALVIAGMALRTGTIPFRVPPPRPAAESARAYLGAAAVAAGIL